MADELSKLLAGLTSEHDQDISHCREWWAESSPQFKLAVWLRIQSMGGEDTVEEMVSRFAQLGMTEIAIRVESDNATPASGGQV